MTSTLPHHSKTPDITHPLRIGLLSNPNSGSNHRGLGAIRKILADYPQVPHREVRTPTDVAAALEAFGRQDLEVVAINAGDGTVQAALTVLFHDRPFAKLPLLALLPGGTTNMTAGDVGLRGNRKKALSKLLAWTTDPWGDLPIVQRQVLRIQPAPDREPLYGMFFGAGAIIRGIEFCHERVYTLGVRSEISSGLATLRMLAAMVRRDPEYIAPVPMSVALDRQQPPQQQDYLILLVSTLERLFLGLRPYWGKENGPLHYTAIRFGPNHTLRALPSLFRGRPNRFGIPEHGYFSHNVNEVHLSMDSSFTLDGELFQVDSRSGPVVVSLGGMASFIRW